MLVCAVIGTCLAVATTAGATQLKKSVFGSGAVQASNASYRITGTLGQPLAGAAGDRTTLLCEGFWCVGAVPVVAVPGPDPESGPPDPDLPKTLAFSAARPNPARGAVTFDLALPADATVRLVLYDVSGRAVSTAPVSRLSAGRHALRWDTRAQGVGPGIYFARLDVNGRTFATRRLAIIR